MSATTAGEQRSGGETLSNLLAAMGLVATATGSMVAVRGSRAIPGGAPVDPSSDSVLRFYAVWWAVQGPRLWRLSRHPSPSWTDLTEVSLTTFLGGLTRLAARRHSGPPHPLFQVLTGAELILPPVLLLLGHQARQLDPPTTRSTAEPDDTSIFHPAVGS